ncbi:MAG: hypothetical protein R6T83_02220 [Salinibacter sp.]
MQQTLLSLLALLIVTLLSFSQQQSSIQGQQQAFRAELEQMALGVAMQTMEVVRARAFDRAVQSFAGGEYADPKEDNFACKEDTPCDVDDSDESTGFGVEGDCQIHPDSGGTDCAVIEDFHGTEGEVPFQLADGTFAFDVEVEVHYVCEDLSRASEGGCTPPTSRKEVVIQVQDVGADGAAPRLHRPIQYSEVITYP